MPASRVTESNPAQRRGSLVRMNPLPSPPALETIADVRALDGRVVLVKSARDHRNPPAGIRGWLEVREIAGSAPAVSIAVEFPQMFSRPAHRRTIPLDVAALERLLATERNGAYEFTVDDELL